MFVCVFDNTTEKPRRGDEHRLKFCTHPQNVPDDYCMCTHARNHLTILLFCAYLCMLNQMICIYIYIYIYIIYI